MYVRKLSDVIHLVQMGVLELHVWGSHVDDLERPDIMVFDLDPDPELAWSEVMRGAKNCASASAPSGSRRFPASPAAKACTWSCR